MTAGFTMNSHCLNVAFYWPRQPEFKSPHIANRQMVTFQFPSGLFKGKRIVAISVLKTGETCLATSIFNPFKKCFKSFIYSLNHILENLRAYFLVFAEGCS